MAKKNGNLHNAKSAKNDEFYTRLEDIENELRHYKNQFKNKVVFCNCDDHRESNFFKYFSLNFEHLGLKKLITMGYKADGKGVAHIYEGDKNGNKIVDDEEITTIELQGNGDFRSEESIKFLKEADIVVTNPPFSLFREYVAQLVEYGKKFLIIGNMNAITYKEIFPLIKEEKIWGGVNFNKSIIFESPYTNNNETNKKTIIKKGLDPNKYIQVPAICWFTNIPTDNILTKESITLVSKYYGNESKYPYYDNYKAINVDDTREIPMDYMEAIGVPISFLGKWNPNTTHTHNHDQRLQNNWDRPICGGQPELREKIYNQRQGDLCENPNSTQTITTNDFEIIGATESEGKGFSNGLFDVTNHVKQPLINNERIYKRVFIRRKNR